MIRICEAGHASLDSAQWRCPWCEIKRLRERLEIRIDTVEGVPTGMGEDEIDRLRAECGEAKE